MDDYKEIAERIRKLKKDNNYSYEKLAEMIGDKIGECDFTRQRLSNMLSGNGETFSLPILSALCDIFGCDAGYILGEIKEKSYTVHDVCNYTHLSEKAVNNICAYMKEPVRPDITNKAAGIGNRHYSYNISEYHNKPLILNLLLENERLYDRLIPYLTDAIIDQIPFYLVEHLEHTDSKTLFPNLDITNTEDVDDVLFDICDNNNAGKSQMQIQHKDDYYNYQISTLFSKICDKIKDRVIKDSNYREQFFTIEPNTDYF